MSGHITRMSRGSRGWPGGSSASSPSSTSRSTSTWRAGPWQACTCTLRSSGSMARADGSAVALAAMSACSQRQQGCGPSRRGLETPVARLRRPPAHRRRERALQLAQVAAERGEQRVADPQVGVVGPARHGAGVLGERVARARRRGAAATGGRRGARRARRAARPRSTAIRVCPNSESRGGRSSAPAPRRSASTTRRAAAPGSAPRPRRPAGARARAARPGRSGAAPPAPSVSSCRSQSASRVGPLHGVRREQAGQPPGDGVAAPAAQLALLALLAVAEVGAERARTRPRRRWRRPPSSSGQTSASGAHGSCSAACR